MSAPTVKALQSETDDFKSSGQNNTKTYCEPFQALYVCVIAKDAFDVRVIG